MRGARSFLGIGLGFLLAIAVVAGVNFFGPAPSGKGVSAPKPSLAQANRGAGATGTNPVSPVATVSPSSIEGLGSSTPSSFLPLLFPLVVAVVLGIAANRLYARRTESG